MKNEKPHGQVICTFISTFHWNMNICDACSSISSMRAKNFFATNIAGIGKLIIAYVFSECLSSWSIRWVQLHRPCYFNLAHRHNSFSGAFSYFIPCSSPASSVTMQTICIRRGFYRISNNSLFLRTLANHLEGSFEKWECPANYAH